MNTVIPNIAWSGPTPASGLECGRLRWSDQFFFGFSTCVCYQIDELGGKQSGVVFFGSFFLSMFVLQTGEKIKIKKAVHLPSTTFIQTQDKGGHAKTEKTQWSRIRPARGRQVDLGNSENLLLVVVSIVPRSCRMGSLGGEELLTLFRHGRRVTNCVLSGASAGKILQNRDIWDSWMTQKPGGVRNEINICSFPPTFCLPSISLENHLYRLSNGLVVVVTNTDGFSVDSDTSLSSSSAVFRR